ncbi:ABC transporter permease [Ancylobacter sp. WKF20]|uniref:ABC transporter permease n=1 Tax=Ancylobacter sp. WKF20 TaxID=3039801 RepID=UPI00243425D1|nr:ABC transporter permease [Ancylobacter sp. WKF20]WGD29743.1 ABC transporter permease [Ancylobacter sp. WKF20]
MSVHTQPVATGTTPGVSLKASTRWIFVNLGILPILLIAAMLFFALQEERFLSSGNLFNVGRQSTFLIILAMGQMIVILTAGLDLSAGSTVGFSGVVSALVLLAVLRGHPDAIVLAALASVAAGLAAGLLVGAVNGFGVAVLGVSPFMMTLGTSTSLVGIALTLTQGLPVTGVPDDFMRVFGYGRFVGLAPPMIATLVLFVVVWVLLNRTTVGRYFYAVGSNMRSAQLSGIATKRQLFLAYILSSLMAAVVGILFVARSGSAEALNGQPFTLQAVAACVIGGISLFGGVGRVRDVVLGALFITLLTNGMNLIRVESYVQQIVLGAVLILSLVADQIRIKFFA